MSQSLIEQIEKAIKDAAWELCEYDHDRDNESFVKGAYFVLPLLKKCIEQRDLHSDLDSDEWTKEDNSELFKLLGVESE